MNLNGVKYLLVAAIAGVVWSLHPVAEWTGIPYMVVLAAALLPVVRGLQLVARSTRPGLIAPLRRCLNAPADPIFWLFATAVLDLCVYGLADVMSAIVALFLGFMALPQRTLDRLILPRDTYKQIWRGNE